MKTVKVPDDLYEKLKELAGEDKPIHEVIRTAIEKMEVGDVQIQLPKPKFIQLRYPAWCVLGNHKIDPEEYRKVKGRYPWALWFPELGGVICLDCLIREVFTKEQQAKTLAKLEVEIRKLRAIRNELNREVNDLSAKVSILETISQLSDIIHDLRGLASDIEQAVQNALWGKEERDEAIEKIRELIQAIREIAKRLESLQLPSKWVEKALKQNWEEKRERTPKKRTYYSTSYYRGRSSYY